MDLPQVIIVSGLPRSGTSMMMQALEAGGLRALIDNIRQADEDNPKGYYEYEPVKKTKEDSSWLTQARGKVVKMVYKLLYDLPDDYEYRVIFMQRSMKETLKSQKTMLERSGKKGAGISDEELAQLFQKQLDDFNRWIAEKPNFKIMYVNYKDIIENPQERFEQVSQFLAGPLDIQAMTTVVDPSLYRNRE